jgi:peptidyl-prolyl isomerase F (cyclophilin D)
MSIRPGALVSRIFSRHRLLSAACALVFAGAALPARAADTLPRVAMELSVGGKPAGRLVIELRKDVAPKTVENFRALCTGEKGYGYKGSPFYYALKDNYVHGGDFVAKNGTNGKSIYGSSFSNENYTLPHVTGAIAMRPMKPGQSDSNFAIYVMPAKWLDGQEVVFGRVVEGLSIISEAVGAMRYPRGPLPQETVITSCEQLN